MKLAQCLKVNFSCSVLCFYSMIYYNENFNALY